MKYFTEDFLSFFQELKSNNHKEWFHSQKKRYQESIKRPFEHFIDELIARIQTFDPSLDIRAKDCILRINRDIRFSKNKSPYNLFYTAFVSHGGRKDKSIPGIFLRFSPKMVGIMGGCYGPSKEQLLAIRQAIMTDTDSFQQLLQVSVFQEKFGEIKGDKAKRVPKEIKETAETEGLMLNKQFYVMAEREAELITSEKLVDEIMAYWHAMRPLNEFLYGCMKKH